MLIFAVLASILLKSRLKNDQNNHYFSFLIRRNHKITLNEPQSKTLSSLNSKSNWFYIHFLIDNISQVASQIPISTQNLILKNTYLLYLSEEQFSKIANISLAKILDPEDKFNMDQNSLEKAQYLSISGPKAFILNENSKFFSIDHQRTSDSYIIQLNTNSLQEKYDLIHRLASEPSIRSISIYNMPVLKNNINAGFTQKNSVPIQKDENSGFYYTERYFNENGINGQGQIITMQDTLVDFHHAMFNDDDATFDVNVTLNHRKFVYYYYKGSVEKLEKAILRNEHGTHVAGTMVGDTSCSSNTSSFSIFNGNAPKAKLIYFPLSSVSVDTIAQTMNEYDSRISSNSWDYMGFNDEGNFEFGNSAYNNPGIIFVFAAGNEYQGGNFTIDDPSGSKNVLCVGAISDFYQKSHKMRFQDSSDSSFYIDADEIKMFDPYFEGILGKDNQSDIILINAEETNDCNLFGIKKYFLTYASSTDKAAWVKKCYAYDSEGIFVTYEVEKVLAFFGRLENKNVTLFHVTPINESQSIEHAYYSSGGPGNRGIIKPDVVAPGTRIMSAKSVKGNNETHGCRDNGISDVTTKEGTSQATPNVAGAAALISQYFQSGKWKYLHTLDSSTVRALIINSCRHPMNSKTPDVLYGHGVVDLSTVLPLAHEFGVQITRLASISENDHQVASLFVNSRNSKVQITMSYLDPMMDMYTPLLLTHDLDLIVVSPSGKIYKGDHIELNDTQHLSTNEKVIIDPEEIEIGEYKIHILTGSFIDADITNQSQAFSVVATGDIENNYLQFSSAESCLCDECDDNHHLHCKCDSNFIGPACQTLIQTQKSTQFSVSLKAHEIRRISIKSANVFDYLNYITNVQVDASDFGYSSVWIDKQCKLQLSEYESTIGDYQETISLNSSINYKSSDMCITIFNNDYQDASFDISISKKNNIMYVIIAVGCFVGVLVFVIVGIVIYKVRRNKERNGFKEINAINTID